MYTFLLISLRCPAHSYSDSLIASGSSSGPGTHPHTCAEERSTLSVSTFTLVKVLVMAPVCPLPQPSAGRQRLPRAPPSLRPEQAGSLSAGSAGLSFALKRGLSCTGRHRQWRGWDRNPGVRPSCQSATLDLALEGHWEL